MQQSGPLFWAASYGLFKISAQLAAYLNAKGKQMKAAISKARLKKALLISICVTPLAGCGISQRPPVNFLELSSVVSPLIGAQGKTLDDQRKIDRTISASCSTGVLGSVQCNAHSLASAGRRNEIRLVP